MKRMIASSQNFHSALMYTWNTSDVKEMLSAKWPRSLKLHQSSVDELLMSKVIWIKSIIHSMIASSQSSFRVRYLKYQECRGNVNWQVTKVVKITSINQSTKNVSNKKRLYTTKSPENGFNNIRLSLNTTLLYDVKIGDQTNSKCPDLTQFNVAQLRLVERLWPSR